jgi:hypothetical protein
VRAVPIAIHPNAQRGRFMDVVDEYLKEEGAK